jgi:predicted RNase H-like HicB family nuclease
MASPLELIDATKAIPIPAVQIWWSREYQTYIATAPALAGVFGVGPTFSEAARCLEDALAHWVEHGNNTEPREPR